MQQYTDLELPTEIRLSDGQEYSVAGDLWVLPEVPGLMATVKFNWTVLQSIVFEDGSIPVMSGRATSLFKLYLLERMSLGQGSLKPLAGLATLKAIQNFARWLAANHEWPPVGRSFDWSDLTEDLFDLWLTGEYTTRRKGHSASLMRRFYLWGSATGYPEFSDTVASALQGMHLKSPPRGERVKRRDNRCGPFSREELELIFNACVVGRGAEQDRAIVWTFLETGIRPKQLYVLTNKDVEIIKVQGDSFVSAQSEITYQLRILKLKQYGETAMYHYLPLSEGCAQLLLDLRRADSGPDGQLFWWLPQKFRNYILRRLESFAKAANLRSPHLITGSPELTGEFLHITPYRFRYGLATDRIARRESPDNVAEMLGHKDTSCVDVYADTTPTIADDLQRATDYVLVSYVALMKGEATLPDDSLYRRIATIVPPTHSSESVTLREVRVVRYWQDQRHRQVKDMSIRPVQWREKSEARIDELVARARRKLSIVFPGQDFDGQLWDVTHLLERPNAANRKTLGFTTLSSTGTKLSSRPEDALPSYFGNVIKSWIVISNNISVAGTTIRLLAARYFWSFLLSRGYGPLTPFYWGTLSEDDMRGFEQFLVTYGLSRRGHLSPGTIILFIQHLQRLLDFLANRGICRRINYVPYTSLQRPASSSSLDVKKLMAERKLPAPGVLECLSGIYHRLTTAQPGEVSDWLQIIVSAVAILMLTGLRIGELVTLPFNCEVEERVPKEGAGSPDSYRYGIRYWLEKANTETMRIRWISPTAEPIVRASIARIKQLTSDARERARALEADPSKVPLPAEIACRNTLTRPEVVTLLGYKTDREILSDPQGLLPQHGRGAKSYFYVRDLEAYLLSRREPLLYTVRREDGRVQKLSESLLIIFAKQHHSPRMNPCRLLVEPIRASTFYRYLCSRAILFKSYGSTEEQRGLSVNPHALRHWLIHVAYNGGMEMNLLLRYFAKHHATNMTDYLHFSTEEADAYVPKELRQGSFYVPASVVEGQPQEEDSAR